MICGIIKVEVSVISRAEGEADITLTETLIILHIAKTEFNNCFIIHLFLCVTVKIQEPSHFCNLFCIYLFYFL